MPTPQRLLLPPDIEITHGGTLRLAASLRRLGALPARALVIIDAHAPKAQVRQVRDSLLAAGVAADTLELIVSEPAKSMDTVLNIAARCLSLGLTRSDAVVAVGGGALCDMAGFAASVYRRGVRLVFVPTTLLCAVDAGIGGKNGVNFMGQKNMLGTTYPPHLTLIDPAVFASLPPHEIQNGLAEMVKYGVLIGGGLLRAVCRHPLSPRVLGACCAHKQRIVKKDLHDTGVRRTLNLGHTLAHAVESCSGFTVPHGQAVAMGLAAMTRACQKQGWLTTADGGRILGALRHHSLPTHIPYDFSALRDAILQDKKQTGRTMNLITIHGLGDVRVTAFEQEAGLALLRSGVL